MFFSGSSGPPLSAPQRPLAYSSVAPMKPRLIPARQEVCTLLTWRISSRSGYLASAKLQTNASNTTRSIFTSISFEKSMQSRFGDGVNGSYVRSSRYSGHMTNDVIRQRGKGQSTNPIHYEWAIVEKAAVGACSLASRHHEERQRFGGISQKWLSAAIQRANKDKCKPHLAMT